MSEDLGLDPVRLDRDGALAEARAGLSRRSFFVGVAAGAGGDVDRQGHELKLRADQALYAAKRLGRDRVLTWSE